MLQDVQKSAASVTFSKKKKNKPKTQYIYIHTSCSHCATRSVWAKGAQRMMGTLRQLCNCSSAVLHSDLLQLKKMLCYPDELLFETSWCPNWNPLSDCDDVKLTFSLHPYDSYGPKVTVPPEALGAALPEQQPTKRQLEKMKLMGKEHNGRQRGWIVLNGISICK